jgi:hypothetical protein
MTSDSIAAIATVILLFPMGYFLLASPPFLFVRLDIEPVALLLRGLFNAYFAMMTIAGAVVTMAFAVAGRPVSAICIGLMTAFAVSARRWSLRRMDVLLRARDAGDPDAARQLRRMHWGGMLTNAILLAGFLGSIPYVTSA